MLIAYLSSSFSMIEILYGFLDEQMGMCDGE